MITEPLRALLSGIIDYAGLFPPAALDIQTAAAEYAQSLQGEYAWALGRFVVPVARLDELRFVRACGQRPVSAWRVAAIGGDDIRRDVRCVLDFNADPEANAVVDVLEVRRGDVAAIAELAALVPAYVALYVEVPRHVDPAPLLRAIKETGASAKIRTGGVTPDAIPTAGEVLRFLRCCMELDLPLKATAGLHHPIRATYRLTYAPDAPCGTMFGFLNVLIAAALLHSGANSGAAQALALGALESTDAAEFDFEADGVSFRRRKLTIGELQLARRRFVHAFGSCSFREPIDGLRALGLL